jgi:1,4-dihydroxy-2-naphthoyl-CoA synthase
MPDISDEAPFADGKILKHAADGVGVITFNNPDKRNAMSLEMWEGFGEALTALRDDDAVRVVILRRHQPVREDPAQRGSVRGICQAQRRPARAARRLSQADDRLHPGFLSRRRHAGRDARRHPHRRA